ncbi:MAG: hypothetical protein RLZZ47_500 [Bacteroidota bacterium]
MVIQKGYLDSSKKTYINLGKTNIQNSSDSDVMISIQNDKIHYIATIYKQTNKDIILPEGQYQITSWINIESNEEPYQKLLILPKIGTYNTGVTTK